MKYSLIYSNYWTSTRVLQHRARELGTESVGVKSPSKKSDLASFLMLVYSRPFAPVWSGKTSGMTREWTGQLTNLTCVKSGSLARIEKLLEELAIEHRLGLREPSVISAQTIESAEADESVWYQIGIVLGDVGITSTSSLAGSRGLYRMVDLTKRLQSLKKLPSRSPIVLLLAEHLAPKCD